MVEIIEFRRPTEGRKNLYITNVANEIDEHDLKVNNTDFTSQLTLTQSSTRCHASRYLQPQCSCAAYSNSFLPRTIRDWNALAMDPLLFQTVDAFKNYLFTDPLCIYCRFSLIFYPPETWLTQPL